MFLTFLNFHIYLYDRCGALKVQVIGNTGHEEEKEIMNGEEQSFERLVNFFDILGVNLRLEMERNENLRNPNRIISRSFIDSLGKVELGYDDRFVYVYYAPC